MPICPVWKLAWWCCTLFRLKRSSVHRKRGKILFSLTPLLVCVPRARCRERIFYFSLPSILLQIPFSLSSLFLSLSFFYFCSSSKGCFLIPIFLSVFVVYAKVMRKTGKSDTRDRMLRIACKHFQIPSEIFVFHEIKVGKIIVIIRDEI